MSKLKKLETKKLLKELEFVESDFEYKNQVIGEADVEFLNSVNTFLETQPHLKELFDNKINDKIDKMIKEKENEIRDMELAEQERINDEDENNGSKPEDVDGGDGSNSDDQEEKQDLQDIKSPKMKKLYRDIVKLTHPDKVNNKKLNDLYIKATEFYDRNDIAGIYSICDDLNVDYEVEEEDNSLISEKINKLKQRIGFMESTFTFKWNYAKDEQEKTNIILTYIKMQLNS